jgi:hypothetical protein
MVTATVTIIGDDGDEGIRAMVDPEGNEFCLGQQPGTGEQT